MNLRTPRSAWAPLVLLVLGLVAGACQKSRAESSSRSQGVGAPAGKEDPGRKAKDDAPKPGTGAPTAPKSPRKHRWEFLTDHVYRWTHERRAVGTTSFRLAREKPGAPASFKVEARFSYENEGTSITSERRYQLDANWRPLRLEVQTGVHTIKDVSAILEVEGRRSGSEWITSTVMNRDRERASETRLDYARDAFVMWPQSVELWAIYAPAFLPVDEEKKIRVLFPYFAKTYEVTVTPKGAVEFRLGSETVPCLRYRLRSGDGQLSGEIWVDETGRMLAYEQGKLTIRLEPKKPKEEARTRGAPEGKSRDGSQSGTRSR